MRTPNPYRGLRGLPEEIWIISAATFVNRAGVMALPFLVLYLTKHLNVPASLAGVAISVYGLGGLITAPFAGRLADRIGPFVVMRASFALSGTMLLLMPLAKNFGTILVLTFVWALVAEATRPATMSALTGLTKPEQRKAAIALHRLAINLGMSIGPALGGFIALVSFPMLFFVDGATAIAAAVVLSLLLWMRRGSPKALHEHPPHTTAERAAVFSKTVVWRDRAALTFFVSSLLMSTLFTQHMGALPLYLVRDLHYRESFYGGLFVLNTLLIVALEVPLNLATAHWPARFALPFATVLTAFGFGGLAIAQAPIPIYATVVFWTFGEMIFFPGGTAHVAALAPRGRTGEYMGAFSSTFALSTIVGPWLGVALLDSFGPVVMWSTMLALGLFAAWLGARRPAAAKQGPPATA